MSKSLVEILEENEVKLRKKGDKWSATCPFHTGDRTPSFFVYPNMTYFCFGCNVWGDAVKFLMDYKGMPYEMALEYAGPEGKYIPVQRKVIPVRTGGWLEFLRECVEDYHQFLLKTPGAINYLHSRGLTDETISKYRLGFSDGAVLNLDDDNRYEMARLLGLIGEDKNNWWETMSQRITIPHIVDKYGFCDFITGRTVAKSSIKYYGLKIAKPLYGLLDAKDSPLLFLVEGQFDWLILKQWGYPAIVGGGTNLTADNILALRSRKVIIIPDNDEEGIIAAEKTHALLPYSDILNYVDLGVKDIGELGTHENGEYELTDAILRQNWKLDLLQTASILKPLSKTSESVKALAST